MQCELCKQNEAAVHLKHAFNGEVREVHLCSECAAKKGFVAKLSPASISDFLFGIEAQRKHEAAGADVTCPSCHMRRSDFRKTSRFGCEACYQAFAEDLGPMLDDFQRGCQHVGKVPFKERHSAEIAVLQKQLSAVIELQQYEEAAKIRDAIQAIRDDATDRRPNRGEAGQ